MREQGTAKDAPPNKNASEVLAWVGQQLSLIRCGRMRTRVVTETDGIRTSVCLETTLDGKVVPSISLPATIGGRDV